MQKKIFYIFIVLVLFLINSSTVFAVDENKPPRVNVFNRAVKNGDIDKIKQYLDNGFDINETYMGVTILCTAIQKKQNETLDFLLANGADPNNSKSQVSALYYAVTKKNKYAVKKLLEYNADQNKTFMGNTSEQFAKSTGSAEIVSIFNEHNSKLHTKTSNTNLTLNNTSKSLISNNDKILKAGVITASKKGVGLIEIKKSKKISPDLLKRKKTNDKLVYKKHRPILTDDQYKLYIILDKIIRANKLHYQNWRFGINLSPEDINAKALAANLIIIDSGLYDSIYQNDDALAFVLSHEIAHFLLGHHQISAENSYKIQQLEKQVAQSTAEIHTQNNLSAINNATGNYYSAMGNSVSSLACSVSVTCLNNEINAVYKQERLLENYADEEAMNLLIRAGFNYDNAIEAFSLLSSLPNIYTNRSTHPDPQSRLVNVNQIVQISDIERLKNEGDNNLYNSNVLSIKKSSDKNTIIINKTNAKPDKYTPETREIKLIQLAYKNYLNNDFNNAENLFKQAFALNQNNYLPMLYLSYINEQYYTETKEKKYLKFARRWIKKAGKIEQNAHVLKQQEDIRLKIKNLKKKETNQF